MPRRPTVSPNRCGSGSGGCCRNAAVALDEMVAPEIAAALVKRFMASLAPSTQAVLADVYRVLARASVG
jgi:hypothetical protein